MSLNKAFTIAEKVDRLIPKTSNDSYDNSYIHQNKPSYSKNDFKKRSYVDLKKNGKDSAVEELTKRMKNLTINTCFFCVEEGHIQKECPKLGRVLLQKYDKTEFPIHYGSRTLKKEEKNYPITKLEGAAAFFSVM